MKKRLIAILATLLILTFVFPASVPAAARAETVPTEAQVYQKLIAMKSEYPEGMPWTNDDFYAWNGGGKYYGGYGCVAFAYILSDAAFGSLPSRYISDIQIKNVHVGDLLRINNNTHTVIVLQVNGTESVTIAEGNYNKSIHWGRTLSAEQIADSSTTELQTRYPEGTFDQVPVEGISLNYTQKTLTLPAGKTNQTVQLVATVKPSNASNKKVSWKSSDEGIAAVDDEGLVTAVSVGECTITCASKSNKNITATCRITVEKEAEPDEPGNPPAPDTATPTVGALKYRLSGSSATVTAPKNRNAKKLTIPGTITVGGRTYKVNAIDKNAFKGMNKLTTVIIGQNIKTIGKNAFYNCKALKTITIKTKKLTSSSVKANAFKGIRSNATFRCPDGKAKAYQKILLKRGAPKTSKFR